MIMSVHVISFNLNGSLKKILKRHIKIDPKYPSSGINRIFCRKTVIIEFYFHYF